LQVFVGLLSSPLLWQAVPGSGITYRERGGKQYGEDMGAAV